jgi:hypothetical protein
MPGGRRGTMTDGSEVETSLFVLNEGRRNK